jgi:polyisoprenoid-binding protein YceI
MTFVSTGIEKTSDKTSKLTGDLTLLGVTKPVTLDITFNNMAPHPLPAYNGVMVAGFSARGKLKRSDFGMSYATPGVGDDIELWLEVEGHGK